jgi:hypothetical protein
MLTGRNPHYVNLEQKKLPIHKDIVRICRTATAKEREKRFESVAKLREKIKGHLWKRKIKTTEHVESVLKDVLDRAYKSKGALEERMEKAWGDINYLSDMLEKDVLEIIADKRRDLAEEIFEEELIKDKEVRGTTETLFASLEKIKGMPDTRFKDVYKRIYDAKNKTEEGASEFRQRVSDYLNNKLDEYIATLLKVDPSGYKSIISKIDESVVKTVNRYDHEHIFKYELKVLRPILESYDRAYRMTEHILKQLDPENTKYAELSEKIEKRMAALAKHIRREEKPQSAPS